MSEPRISGIIVEIEIDRRRETMPAEGNKLVKPASARADKYNLKYDPEHICQIGIKDRKGREAKYHDSQQSLAAAEYKTKLTLGRFSITPCHYINYINYSRQLWKLRRRFAGQGLYTEAAIVLLKWKMRKLEEAALIAIRNEVYHIPEPAEPIV